MSGIILFLRVIASTQSLIIRTSMVSPTEIPVNREATTPLVVDLDGTLTPTDTLVESVILVIKQSPLNLLRLPFWLLRGRAAFKETVATHARISAKDLPYNEPLLDYIRSEKEKGRQIILATATHQSVARDISTHLDLFDDVLATNANCNLKGQAKLEAIQQRVGDTFVYAGDSPADIPIWNAAQAAVLVGVSASVAGSVHNNTPIEQAFTSEDTGLAVWLHALRVHQWVKNLLIFVPLLTAFSFTDMNKLSMAVFAFLAFCLAASANYIVNDLWDLENDRKHPRKRLRPFANARIPVLQGIAAAAGLFVLACLIALAVSVHFFLMLLLYLFLSVTYSWALKEYVLIDVLVLSLLYTLRILAGSVAIGIATSSWLLAFSVFIFLSLALIKRCSELVSLGEMGETATQGRDYRVTDLVVLWPLGVGAGLSAVVVFGLFITGI